MCVSVSSCLSGENAVFTPNICQFNLCFEKKKGVQPFFYWRERRKINNNRETEEDREYSHRIRIFCGLHNSNSSCFMLSASFCSVSFTIKAFSLSLSLWFSLNFPAYKQTKQTINYSINYLIFQDIQMCKKN